MMFLMLIALPQAPLAQGDDEEEEDNPHVEMIDDEFICLDCHTKVPKAQESAADYFLFDTPSENCLGCHDEMEHAGVKEHEGMDSEPLPGDENGKIACFSCHDPHPGGVIEGRKVYDAIAGERTREFVSTVVLPGVGERLGMEVASDTKKEVYLRLPLADNELCIKCHEDIKETNWREKTLWNKFIGLFSYK